MDTDNVVIVDEYKYDTFWDHINSFKCPVCNETYFPLFGEICYRLCNHPDYCNLHDDYILPILTTATPDSPLSSSPKNDETYSLDCLKVLTSTSPDSPNSSSFSEEDEEDEEPQEENDDEYLPLSPLPRVKSAVKRPVKSAVKRTVKRTVKSVKSKNINFMKKFGDFKDNSRIIDNDDEILHKTGYTKYQLVDMDLYEKRKRFVFKSDLYDYVCSITRRYKNRVYARHSRSKKIRN
jgi:hypothetical protein